MKRTIILIFILLLLTPAYAQKGYDVNTSEISIPGVEIPSITVPVDISSAYATSENKTPFDFIMGPVQLATAEVNTFSAGAVKSVTQLKTTLVGMEESSSRYILVDLILGGDQTFYKTQMNSIKMTELDSYTGKLVDSTMDALYPLTKHGYEVKDQHTLINNLQKTVEYAQKSAYTNEKVGAERSSIYILKTILPHAMSIYKRRGWQIKREEILEQLEPYLRSKIKETYFLSGSRYHQNMFNQVNVYLGRTFDYQDEDKYSDNEIFSKILENAQVENYNIITKESLKVQRDLHIYNNAIRTSNYIQTPSLLNGGNVSEEFVKGLNQSIQMNMNSDKLKKYLVGSWRYKIIKRALDLYNGGTMVTNIDKFSKKLINNTWVIYYKDRPATGYEAVLYNPY